jgi:hypothetical protein
MSRPPRRRALAALAPLLAAFALCAPAGAAPSRADSKGDVHVRGTVYAFDDQDPIAGARVRVVELPAASAVSGPDGAYDLVVPDGTRVTPYVEAAGYHGIHLQTFVTAGNDLERFNFQVPSDGIYAALAALVGVELDAGGNQVRCAIVSTFSTANVRDLGFADFVAYGAHGVAGATATTTPPLPDPIYFNESVVPDPTQTESSIDGGVLWTEVPDGVYRVAASHPSERFAEFAATCTPGRLVNANPPQGLYQLRPGEQLDERVAAAIKSARFHRPGRRSRVVKAKLRAKEYVTIEAELRRGGKTLATTPPDEGEGAYATGKQRLKLRVKPGVDPGPVKLRVTFTDAAGNVEVDRKRLHLPERRDG